MGVIAYVVLVEMWECAEEVEPCKYRHQCNRSHRLRKLWAFGSGLTVKMGTAHNHLARVTKHAMKNRDNLAAGYTGEVKLVAIDSDKLSPVWDDAEVAAYKLGGLEAVKRLQKGLVAEAKANERARVKAEKEAAKQAARAARKRVA